ncbi:peptide chain release factor N(5)-glutamine methyltransferase [Devosia neptuniae]|uniref:Release factor glutamine methyltransferase n=1 Tax=Devosia neptuniae TaxID=191302 RepID=A0ABY6CHN0_9HYPH|nr:HemK/PrmC family methyltransferase [Devosia neptuniae]UXN71715.1 peptide chain release factor N(5)-glutamine methyltransferase [Devosia neptuniae]
MDRQGFASPALDAKLLAGYGLGLTALDMALRENEPVEAGAAERIAGLMQRRLSGESVARIIGEREFYGLAFALNGATLEPRPETELLVDMALDALPQGGQLLDLGTGTGCIPIAVLVNRADASGVATDLSAEALVAAQGNAERHGVAERLVFLQGSWFEPLIENPHPSPPHKGEGTAPRVGLVAEIDHQTNSLLLVGRGGGSDAGFDLIVSNPPYINSAVIETLADEVKSFDPRLALDGGPDGLAPYRVIAAQARNWLKRGGRVLVEIGYDQGEAVTGLFEAAGFTDVTLHKDLNGLDRVVSAHHV